MIAHAGLSAVRRHGAASRLADRQPRGFQRAVGHHLPRQPASARAVRHRRPMAQESAQRNAPADAVVFTARDERRRSPRGIPLHPQPRRQRRTGAGVRAAGPAGEYALFRLRAEESAGAGEPLIARMNRSRALSCPVTVRGLSERTRFMGPNRHEAVRRCATRRVAAPWRAARFGKLLLDGTGFTFHTSLARMTTETVR